MATTPVDSEGTRSAPSPILVSEWPQHSAPGRLAQVLYIVLTPEQSTPGRPARGLHIVWTPEHSVPRRHAQRRPLCLVPELGVPRLAQKLHMLMIS